MGRRAFIGDQHLTGVAVIHFGIVCCAFAIVVVIAVAVAAGG